VLPVPAANYRERVPLALYRRYRPESFAQVIGQEHVTGPLQQALRNDRVHHAYLFSGPRGCGKTTSARILARALNCEQGPTPEPCGECASCQDLARGGPGSLDVIEIDAASHGGVDDARDLRERAFFAPASSRFKIYIVDEAHMVSTQGFNALLKLVEEPPQHVKFVFATTEPEKVIGTIRSRTHHYPFRLVPPGTLTTYLGDLCAREGIEVAPTVLPLVVRAGAGSVRDSLSVLDQLLSGAGESGVTYAMAAALLGYTDAALLDAVVDAFAASDGAAAFELVDRVVEAGHDPRRFVADLLDRVRDLMLVDAVPDAVDKGLVVGPPEEVAALPGQAARFGRSELVRAAEILNVGLTEMRGATAPRLQLELICARVLLPGASVDEIGLGARVDRIERRLAIAAPGDLEPESGQASAGSAATAIDAPLVAAAALSEPAGPSQPVDKAPEAGVSGATAASDTPDRSSPQTLDIIELRRQWPGVLDEVKAASKVTWLMMFEKVTVASIDSERLVVAFPEGGTLKAFMAGGRDVILRDAVNKVLGLTIAVDGILDPSRAPKSTGPTTPTGDYTGEPASGSDARPSSAAHSSGAAPGVSGGSGDHRMPRPRRAAARRAAATPGAAAAPDARPDDDEPVAPVSRGTDEPDPSSDPDVLDNGESEEALVARTLGAVVVERVSDT